MTKNFVQQAPQMTQMIAPDIAAQQVALQRQQQLADLLKQQGMAAPEQTQVISGVAVKQSPLIGLSKMLQAYMGGKMQDDNDAKGLELGKALQDRSATEMNNFMQAFSGKPAIHDAPEELGLQGPAYDAPAVPGDRRKAMAMALSSNNPKLNGIGSELLKQDMAVEKFGNTPHYDQKGGAFVLGDKGTVKPLSGVSARDKMENVNGVFVNPYNQQAGAIAPENLNNLVNRDANGNPVLNQALFNAKNAIAATGKTNLNVAVNTDKKYAEHVAGGLATQDLAAIDAGKSASERIANAHRIKDILAKNPITGTGAEARLILGKAFSTAGLIDGANIKNTEDLSSLLASGTLDAIKTSGLGAGQGFTDKDRQFLEKAKSGNLEINAGTLSTLADLNERAARASITRSNAIAKRWSGDKSMGGVGQDMFIEMPAPYTQQQNNNAAPNQAPVSNGWGIKRLP